MLIKGRHKRISINKYLDWSEVVKKFGKILLVLLIPLSLFIINNAVYPFSTTHPNFSDVERVFNKMQFPSDWEEIDSSENRGIAGRACPIESATKCYHKRKLFKLSNKVSLDVIEGILKKTGCSAVSFTENKPVEGTSYDNYQCSTEGVTVSGTLYKKSAGWEASFSTSNR